MATPKNKEDLIELYIATFNRAPDAEGFNYWLNESPLQTMEEIAQSFFDQPETKALYPEGTSDEEFITAIYHNVFGREPDEEGLKYWVSELQNGNLDRSVMILAMVNGAQAEDNIMLEHKMQVAEKFIEAGISDVDLAKEVIANVTADATSVVEALNIIKAHSPGETFELKGAVETLKGTIASDTFDATKTNTLNSHDKIIDPSTQDNDELIANLTTNLGTPVNDNAPSEPIPQDIDNQYHSARNPKDGPTIKNVETITLNDDLSGNTFNVYNISGTKVLKIGTFTSTDEDFISSDDKNNDILEIREIDGHRINNLQALDSTKALKLTEVSGELNVILHEKFQKLLMEAKDSLNHEKVSVELKGTKKMVLGLSDDNDLSDADEPISDGASFGELKLVSSENNTFITLAQNTSLNNVTPSNVGTTDKKFGNDAQEAAHLAEGEYLDPNDPTLDGDNNPTFNLEELQAGITVIGDSDFYPASLTVNDLEANIKELKGHTNLALADKLILEGDKDITIKGSAIQLDEANIRETNDNALNSTLVLNTTKAEAGSSIDLTEAEVDRVKVSVAALTEVDVDENTIVEVNKIADEEELIVTGDSKNDILEIEINTHRNDAALGALILGGDAHANTTDFDKVIDPNSKGETKTAKYNNVLDTDVADAKTAVITVTSDSNLNILDVSQLTAPSFTIKGDKDFTIGTLIMGGADQGSQASILHAEEFTGDFTADLVIGEKTGYDDGAGVNGDEGHGNRIYLGSGDDVLGNVGIIYPNDHSSYELGRGDDIKMGAGDDIVEIGTQEDISGHALSAEIYGGEGRDTFIIRSLAENGEDTEKVKADGTSEAYVQIKDFEAGHGGDQIEFDNLLLHNEGKVYANGKVVSDKDAIIEHVQEGDVILVATDDVDSFTREDVIDLIMKVEGEEDAKQYVFAVGEHGGNDGIKLFYVDLDAEGEDAIHLVGQLTNAHGNVNIDTLSDDNFDFL